MRMSFYVRQLRPDQVIIWSDREGLRELMNHLQLLLDGRDTHLRLWPRKQGGPFDAQITDEEEPGYTTLNVITWQMVPEAPESSSSEKS